MPFLVADPEVLNLQELQSHRAGIPQEVDKLYSCIEFCCQGRCTVYTKLLSIIHKSANQCCLHYTVARLYYTRTHIILVYTISYYIVVFHLHC